MSASVCALDSEDLSKSESIKDIINGETMLFSLETHALVKFVDKGSTAVIPMTRLVQSEGNVGGLREVIWTNKKKYKTSYIMSG